MKSGKILAIIVLIWALATICDDCYHYFKTGRFFINLFPPLLIILAVGLWKHRQRAYRNLRRLLWFFFAAALLFGLISFFGSDFHFYFGWFRHLSIVEIRTIFTFTLICSGAVLYYTETDKVLNDFKIEKPVKKTVVE